MRNSHADVKNPCIGTHIVEQLSIDRLSSISWGDGIKLSHFFIWLNEGMRERWRLTMKKISAQHTHTYTQNERELSKKKKNFLSYLLTKGKKVKQKKVFTREEKYAVSKKKFRTLERGVYFVEGPCWRIKLKTSSSKKGQPPHQPIQPPYPESGIKSNQKKIKKNQSSDDDQANCQWNEEQAATSVIEWYRNGRTRRQAGT